MINPPSKSSEASYVLLLKALFSFFLFFVAVVTLLQYPSYLLHYSLTTMKPKVQGYFQHQTIKKKRTKTKNKNSET